MPGRVPSLPLVLFGLLLASCLTLVLAVAAGSGASADGAGAAGDGGGSRPGASGAAHPRFPSMDHGGSGPRRHGPVLGLAWAFGILQLALVVGCLALGVRRRRARAPLAAAGLVLGLIVTMMVVSYRGHLADPDAAFLSLPVPTAWFLYGFWPAQFLVVGIYVLLFDRAVVTPDDVARFRALVAGNAAGAVRGRPDPPAGRAALRRRRPVRSRGASAGSAPGPAAPPAA